MVEYSYADEQSFKANQPTGKVVLNFDSNGKLLDYFSVAGGVGLKHILKYERQRIVSTAYLKDSIIGHAVARLDKYGRRVEEEYYTGQSALPASGGMIRSRIVIKYDTNGDVMERDKYDGGKAIDTKKTYVYNDKNQKIEEITESYEADSAVTSRTVYAYDAAGNEVRHEDYDFGELVFIQLNAYSNFDQDGNWLVRVSNDSDNKIKNPAERTSKSFTRREIKYFQ